MSDQSLMDMICSNCHWGLYEDHPEFRDWNKCEACGFCIQKVAKGLAAWLPTPETTKEFYKCKCGDPTVRVCYYPYHRKI